MLSGWTMSEWRSREATAALTPPDILLLSCCFFSGVEGGVRGLGDIFFGGGIRAQDCFCRLRRGSRGGPSTWSSRTPQAGRGILQRQRWGRWAEPSIPPPGSRTLGRPAGGPLEQQQRRST